MGSFMAEVIAQAQQFISDDEFRAETERCGANLMPEPGDDGVTPHLLVLHRQPDMEMAYDFYVMPDAFGETDTKYNTLEAIGSILGEEHKAVVAIFLVSEAWLSTCTTDEVEKHPYRKAGDDPNRQEAAIVAGRTLDNRHSMSMSILNRDGDGNIRTVGATETDYDLMRTGKLRSDLLDTFYLAYMKAYLGADAPVVH